MLLKLLKEDRIEYDETNNISIYNHLLFTLHFRTALEVSTLMASKEKAPTSTMRSANYPV